MIDFTRSYFELFGLPPRFSVDTAVLDQAYRALQSDIHPDRFAGASDAQQRIALQSSARVNEAYRALKDPVQRAQYLLRLHGIETVGQTDTQLPLAFLERQLERREAAGDAHAAGDAIALAALLEEVRAEARRMEEGLTDTLDAQRAFASARAPVRELTFLHKLAHDLDEMLAALDDR